jgi:hypothetical protein
LSAVAVAGVVLLLSLGAATAAPCPQEDGREDRGRNQNRPPHAAKDTNKNAAAGALGVVSYPF